MTEKKEVEDYLIEGLSLSVFLKFARQLPNLTKLLLSQDFWNEHASTFLNYIHRFNFNISNFERFKASVNKIAVT